MNNTRPRLIAAAYCGSAAAILTFCTAGRRPLFTRREVVDRCWHEILRASASTGVEIVAYCFMPDHVHLLVETREGGDITRFAKLAKQLSGYAHAQATRDRLWQPSWHDRLLRDSDDRLDVVRYVLANPARAGLVDDIREYPFLGSATTTREALLEWVMSGGPGRQT
jgi:putative transposase